MTDTSSISWSAEGELEVVSFGLGGETFALEALLVREIVDLLPATVVPGAVPLVAEVVNFRGRVIPLADLRPAFGMEQTPATPDSRIVVVELAIGDEVELIGLKADRVDEVVHLDRSAFETPPSIGVRWPRSHIRGLIRKAGNHLIVLPDIEAILAPAAGGCASPSSLP